jgi:hypothetical protein
MASVNVAALEVFNQLGLQHFGIGEVLDANGHGGDFGNSITQRVCSTERISCHGFIETCSGVWGDYFVERFDLGILQIKRAATR